MTGPGPVVKRPVKRRPRKRKFSDPGASYARRLERYRPGIVRFTLDGLAELVHERT